MTIRRSVLGAALSVAMVLGHVGVFAQPRPIKIG